SPKEIADVFIRHVAPLLRENLYARLDGQELKFTGEGRRDDTVKDHLRCDFTFQGAWKPTPGQPHTFTFREGNYEQEDFNRIQLPLTAGPGVTLQSTTAPDKALLERSTLELKPGDAERLRKASATFVLADAASVGAASRAAPQVRLGSPDVPP